jgi:AcrR family transcriptional regulator
VTTSGSPGGGRAGTPRRHDRRPRAAPGSRPEEPRERLLAVAEKLLADRPAAELSVEAVCRAAGVPDAQFGRLFSDSGQLLAAAFDRLVSELAAEMDGARRAESCWRDRVRAALEVMLARFDRARGLARFLIVDSLTFDPALLEPRASVLARLADELDAGHPETPGGAPPASFGAAAVVGGVAAILHSRLQEGASQPLSALSGPLMGMIVMPYLGAHAARDELFRGTPRPGPARRS